MFRFHRDEKLGASETDYLLNRDFATLFGSTKKWDSVLSRWFSETLVHESVTLIQFTRWLRDTKSGDLTLKFIIRLCYGICFVVGVIANRGKIRKKNLMCMNQIRKCKRGEIFTLTRWRYPTTATVAEIVVDGEDSCSEGAREKKGDVLETRARQHGFAGGDGRSEISKVKSTRYIYPHAVGDTDLKLSVPPSFITVRWQRNSVMPTFMNRWHRGS